MAEIHVTKNGRDSNPGTVSEPKLSIQAGVNAAKAGDVVRVGDGVYIETLRVNTPDISIVAQDGVRPTISGGCDLTTPTPAGALPQAKWQAPSSKGLSYTFGALVLFAASGGAIKGFEIGNSTGRGVQFGTSNTENINNVLIEDCSISYCRGTGLFFMGVGNGKMVNTNIHHNGWYYYGPGVTEGTNHPGIAGGQGVKNLTVEECWIHENAGESFMFDWWKWASDGLTMRRTWVGNSKRASLYLHAAKNIDIKDCMFYTSPDQNVALSGNGRGTCMGPTIRTMENHSYESGGQQRGVENINIENCQFIDNNRSNFLMEHYGQPGTFGRNIRIANSTFIQNSTGLQFSLGYSPAEFENVVIEKNIFYTIHPGTKKMNANRFGAGFEFVGNWFNTVLVGDNTWFNGPATVQGLDPELTNPTAPHSMTSPPKWSDYVPIRGSVATGYGASNINDLPPDPPPVLDWKTELWAKSILLQTISLNPEAALQKAIFADGFVPVESEFWHTVNDVNYAAQAAENLQTGQRRVYYALAGQWDDVQWFTNI